MKKVLLASTALVLSAGVAAADMTVSGDGRMGIISNFGEQRRQLHEPFPCDLHRIGRDRRRPVLRRYDPCRQRGRHHAQQPGRPAFRSTADDVVPGGGVLGVAGSVFISGDFGTLSMGDVAGAPEAAVGDLAGVGLTGLGDLNEMTYLSNRGALQRSAMRYDYSFGDFGVHVSADNPVAYPNSANLRTENETYGAAVTYSGDLFSAGLGWEDRDGVGSHIIGSLSGTFAGVTLKGIFGQADFDGGDTADQWGLSASYGFDATTVTAFYTDRDDGLGSEAFGIGAVYDLGGGASVRGGYVSNETNDTDAFDFGVSMRF
jgi:outer membrane protein OmpU